MLPFDAPLMLAPFDARTGAEFPRRQARWRSIRRGGEPVLSADRQAPLRANCIHAGFLQAHPARRPGVIEQRRADLPKEVANLIHPALAREPGKRFADVLALRQALEPFSQ